MHVIKDWGIVAGTQSRRIPAVTKPKKKEEGAEADDTLDFRVGKVYGNTANTTP